MATETTILQSLFFFRRIPYQPFQGAAPHANTLAFTQKRARLGTKAGSQNSPHCVDFSVGDSAGSLPNPTTETTAGVLTMGSRFRASNRQKT